MMPQSFRLAAKVKEQIVGQTRIHEKGLKTTTLKRGCAQSLC